MRIRKISFGLAAAIVAAIVVGCSTEGESGSKLEHQADAAKPQSSAPQPENRPEPAVDVLPGMPPVLDPNDVYSATRQPLSRSMEGVKELVYVPNNKSDTVSVIDPKTFKVIDTFPGGRGPQHVIPSYDMQTLYSTAAELPGGSLTPIDPRTGKPGPPMDIEDPYNLYFTPDGKSAIVVAEAFKRLDFYDPKTWKKQGELPIPECAGINHMDFTTDGKKALVTCEFANRMITLDVQNRKHVQTFNLSQVPNGMPQDSRLSPDGKMFYVADMKANGVYTFDGQATKQTGFIPTGKGTHGLYFSRDSKRLFISNRGEGSVSVLDVATNKIIDKWHIPGGGSPDMGSLSTDGSQLWLSGRYDSEVYVFDTKTGKVLAQIPVGNGPHGLTYMPQPGRYSLGHTSNIR